jgi:hypothetical protein
MNRGQHRPEGNALYNGAVTVVGEIYQGGSTFLGGTALVVVSGTLIRSPSLSLPPTGGREPSSVGALASTPIFVLGGDPIGRGDRYDCPPHQAVDEIHTKPYNSANATAQLHPAAAFPARKGGKSGGVGTS